MEHLIKQIGESWATKLKDEFSKEYMEALKLKLKQERQSHKIYPPSKETFNALRLTPFEKVKIVILGQDPYHGFGQAHGLAFSVTRGTPIPPSLQNIFKELKDDLGREIPNHGDLTSWAEQGVLLLNTTLTGREANAGSHKDLGWGTFTDKIIQTLSEDKDKIVFILWGKHAQSKIPLIDTQKHLIIKSTHPSPFSAHKGFFGSKPFSKANHFLNESIF